MVGLHYLLFQIFGRLDGDIFFNPLVTGDVLGCDEKARQ